jgi:hypothetical protein
LRIFCLEWLLKDGVWLQSAGKTKSKTVGISDCKITKSVISIPDRQHDGGADIIRKLPVVIYVWDHHSNVRDRGSGLREPLGRSRVMKSGRLGKKKPVVLPRYLGEIFRLAQEMESQPAVKINRSAKVFDQNFRDKLFGRIYVSSHGSIIVQKTR